MSAVTWFPAVTEVQSLAPPRDDVSVSQTAMIRYKWCRAPPRHLWHVPTHKKGRRHMDQSTDGRIQSPLTEKKGSHSSRLFPEQFAVKVNKKQKTIRRTEQTARSFTLDRFFLHFSIFSSCSFSVLVELNHSCSTSSFEGVLLPTFGRSAILQYLSALCSLISVDPCRHRQ